MKKVLAAAFIASLFMINCSKKTDHSLQDSNTMLEEPEAPTVTDSTAKKADTPAATATAPASTATAAAKKDSTAAK
ncbi:MULTISPECIES: hypothetical protein [Chryseobacterium]|uniref:Uncharacterized protein YcfL n=1 Tax=Chryseobacterium camelliae TaxID=1265445 RepID=A0ABU0TF59_9FLAO|nr:MULTISPECIES: hypothetical protein [Chryseobacterium]MDT3406603.1 uncharacterized protein YcfL [Pseudacidovorax intermedius]MDQ1095601.1 uncharacterized protein YcfL [Chryseobacterium camelliae]MDQ1099537.1 uncharacterized protein YcfL [Chryseobacterium sp. SORGH_AS_1048]MDR6086884.1 uncharacterized protein YcfL [Chryseobacterium sp. SORGH_AS_0909]MDR6131258.1 uncharacterized protein YcfL [Chryseobacterium sp. SORGH_AS_1175]